MSVFVLDKRKQPLMPCSEKRARLLLFRGRAIIHKMYPFTIRLKDRVGGDLQTVAVKIDPGSKFTGIAIGLDSIDEEEIKTFTIKTLFQLNHRGSLISKKLSSRSAMRSRRRFNLRYRQPRFNNRTKPKGWLAPSLRHRVDMVINFIIKLKKICPIDKFYQELVKFDMQKMNNPEISGKEYQQGTLHGFETKEYLLEKFNRTCIYCGAQNVPLEVEHVIPKSKGGSNRVSNLTLACRKCNVKKSNKTLEEFLKGNITKIKQIKNQLKRPLKDAAAVNAARWSLYNKLKEFDKPVEVGSGGLTKYNRKKLSIPKSHVLDASCVGKVDKVINIDFPTLIVISKGRGQYQRTKPDKFGFPRLQFPRVKSYFGFQTGDICRLRYGNLNFTGRIVVKKHGYFEIKGKKQSLAGTSYKNMTLISRNDGYSYQQVNFED